MRIRVPSKRIRERFLLVYELEGCQTAVDYLTKYYGIRRMRIVLNGRRVGNGDLACYEENKAYFSKRGLTKRTILHELYHHLAYANGLDVSEAKEDREARLCERFSGLSLQEPLEIIWKWRYREQTLISVDIPLITSTNRLINYVSKL